MLLIAFAIPCAWAQLGGQPRLSVTGMQVTCIGYQPYVRFTLPVSTYDRGRPGLLYVAMHDANMTQAAFLTSGKWSAWTGGLFPAYSIASSGLSQVTISLPLPPALAGGGWKLYAGYGALSVDSESRVQAALDAVSAAKALTGNAGGIYAVDPDHYRRTLIQTDMTQGGKYAYVNTGVESNSHVCDPQMGGGGY